MRIFQSANLLCISLLAIRLLHCKGSCVFLNRECFLQEFDDTIKATLRFTLICQDTTNSVILIKVTTKEKHAEVEQTICQIFHQENKSCSASVGCTCDAVSRQYSVSMAINPTESTQWVLGGYLNGGQKIQSQTRVIDRTYCTLLSDSTTDRTLNDEMSSTNVVKEKSSRSNTPDLTSSIGSTFSIPQDRESGVTDNRDSHNIRVVIMVVVAVVVVLIVMVVLVMVFKLWASVKKIKNRSSSTGITRTEPRPAHPRTYPALFNKDLYGGSNVSLMIINDMYVEGPWNASRDVARARRPLPAPPGGSKLTLPDRADDGCSSSLCEKEGDYAEINSLLGDSKQGACGGQNTYTDVENSKQKTEKPTKKGTDLALH